MSETLDINHVRVGDRHRKDFGDIEALALSIKTIGLLAPIVVTDDNQLVAGHRRLEACRRLGFPTVPVRRVRQINDAVTALVAERDENTCRKDFALSEAVALGLALEEMERPMAEERKAASQAKPGERVGAGHLPAPTPKARTRDVVAPAVGLKPRTYVRAKGVVLAQDDPDPGVAAAAKEAVAQMDADGNASKAERTVKAARGTLTTEAGPEAGPKSRDGMASRIAKATEMAAAGYTSRQIGEAIGVTADGVGAWLKRHDVTVPADAAVGRAQRHDVHRIVEEAAVTLDALVLGLSLVDPQDMDRDRLQQAAISFESSLRSLNRFHKHMKEMAP